MFRNPTTDLIVVLVIVLLIFGPKRLPGLGRQLGQGLREFKESITGEDKESEGAERPELTQASGDPGQGTAMPTSPPERESVEVPSQERRP
jgi:sec-independent protein translocase protein TatA